MIAKNAVNGVFCYHLKRTVDKASRSVIKYIKKIKTESEIFHERV